MEFNLSPQLSAIIPNFKVGIVHYKNIVVGTSPQMLKGRLQLFQESLFFELEDKDVTHFEGIKEWRTIFKRISKDPNRYRPSVEALYRRIKKQQYLQSINSATDINNFFSLQYEIPIGIYDQDKLSGNIAMRLGSEGESYVGLNERENHLQQLILTADEQGPFGSPFVDSKRSSVSETTKNAVQIIYLRPSLDTSNAEAMVQSLMNMFIQIHGGEGQYQIIGS